MSTKTRLAAMEKRMNLGPLPKDLKEASIEQLAQMLGVSQAELAAMTDEELRAIVDSDAGAPHEHQPGKTHPSPSRAAHNGEAPR